MEREKYVLLFPLTFNDGTTVPQATLREFRDELFVIAGGSTVTGTVAGEYRMKSGKKQVDKSAQIWVALDRRDEHELRRVVAVYAGRLGQESMYFERTGSTVEFIEPVPVPGVQ